MTNNPIYYQKANDNLKLATNLMFVAIFLSIPRLFIEMDYVIDKLPSEFPFEPKLFLIGSQIVSFIFGAMFITLVRKQKNWARWLELVISVLTLYGGIKGIIDIVNLFPVSAFLAAVQMILNFVALFFLFQGPAAELFKEKKENI